MNFGHAIELLKQGRRVTRPSWNGQGMYLALQEGSTITHEQARGGIARSLAQEGQTEIIIRPHVDMRAADGTCIVGWSATQSDMLAEDWVEVVLQG